MSESMIQLAVAVCVGSPSSNVRMAPPTPIDSACFLAHGKWNIQAHWENAVFLCTACHRLRGPEEMLLVLHTSRMMMMQQLYPRYPAGYLSK